MKTKGKYVQTITVIEPDTQGRVDIEIYKLETGGMVGIDNSFLDTNLPVYNPFDRDVEIDEETFG